MVMIAESGGALRGTSLAQPARLVSSVLVLRTRIDRGRPALADGRSASTTAMTTRRARRASRGFTLIELMVTVIIIGILAVMAIPSMQLTSFDRDTYNDAGAIMQVFRRARTRAIARGSAVVVQMVTAGNYTHGGFFTYEAVGLNGGSTSVTQTPVASCKYPTTWPTALMTPIDSYFIETNANSTDALAGVMAQPFVYTASSNTGSAFTEGYVCYTPLGHSYINISPTIAGAPPLSTSGTPVFQGFSSVSALEIRVTRTDGATIRSVLIPNNGMARVFSHTQ
jgi:prepilin-type N-terminal cleavage/methylation domain-containing protein